MIDDSARGMPMRPATASAVALDLIGRDEPPMATCPRDGEPLILTFERPGAEFHCLICGSWLGFLAPRPAKKTDALNARLAELEALFKAGKRGPLEEKTS